MTLRACVWWVLLVSGAGCGDDDGPMMTACTGAEGTDGCACRSGTECDEGLFCDEGLCRSLAETGVVVSDPGARSCEALIEERAGEVFDARFEGALGAIVREAPQASLAFATSEDAPFAANAVRLRHSEGAELAVVRAQCFDRDGRPLAGEPVSLR